MWYGECGVDSYGSPLSCAYDGPPKAMTDSDGLNLLQELCPLFAEVGKCRSLGTFKKDF